MLGENVGRCLHYGRGRKQVTDWHSSDVIVVISNTIIVVVSMTISTVAIGKEVCHLS